MHKELDKLSFALGEKLVDSRILSLHWLKSDGLLLCGEDGNLKRIKLLENGEIFVNDF